MWENKSGVQDHDNLKPIFEMTPSTKVDTFWFATDEKTFDFLGGVYTDAEGHWMAKHRFRYYVHPTEAWDGKDEKSSTEVNTHSSEDEARVKLVEVYTSLVGVMEKSGLKVTTMPIHGGIEEFTKALTKQSFAHVKVSGAEPKEVQ